MSKRKQLWVLAGGNGAGKTTFYDEFLGPKKLAFINADILAARLDAANAEAISYKAAKLAEELRMNLLRSGQSFCFETVFSHPSKIDFLGKAKSLDYEITLIYIHLQTDELNQARVAQRVSQGGHTVPAEKITNRIPRTLRNVKQALSLVDYAMLYDNSSQSQPFSSVALLNKGRLEIQLEELPDWAKVMLADFIHP